MVLNNKPPPFIKDHIISVKVATDTHFCSSSECWWPGSPAWGCTLPGTFSPEVGAKVHFYRCSCPHGWLFSLRETRRYKEPQIKQSKFQMNYHRALTVHGKIWTKTNLSHLLCARFVLIEHISTKIPFSQLKCLVSWDICVSKKRYLYQGEATGKIGQ